MSQPALLSPWGSQTLFWGCSGQEAALGDKGGKISSSGAAGGGRGESLHAGFAERRGNMPSQLGQGRGWAANSPGHWHQEVTFYLQKGVGRYQATCSSLPPATDGEPPALDTRGHPCSLLHPAPHGFQRGHTAENGARWKPHLSQSETRWRELGKKRVGSTCRQIWGGDDSSEEGRGLVTFWRREGRWER